MDPELLGYYNRELRYVRELGSEFAQAYPKVAARLGLDAFECTDPYVERLLEGFAFLAARVQIEIDGQFPRFTEHMLDMLCPHYLGPTPSMTVVQFEPDLEQSALAEGLLVPRGTALKTISRHADVTPCEYRTAHAVTLWPLELIGLTHSSKIDDLPDALLRSGSAPRGTVRLRLRTANDRPFSSLSLDELPLYVRGGDAMATRLLELLLCSVTGVAAREPGGSLLALPRGIVAPLGLEDSEALLPVGPRGFHGYRLLHEYFAFPRRLAFARLAGLREALRRCRGSEIEIVFSVKQHDPALEQVASPEHLALFCTPAINLFPKDADRIALTDREHEHHVVVDRTRPLDFEVHSVLAITGLGAAADERRTFLPLYGQRPGTERNAIGYYALHRAPRRLTPTAWGRKARADYPGAEMFVSLVNHAGGPFDTDLRQLAIRTLCTNRDLPLYTVGGGGGPDLVAESAPAVRAVRCVAGPSAPRPAHASGSMAWRLVSQLSLNYLSLTDAPDGSGATSLRELLRLYADISDTAAMRQIEGLRTATGRPVVRKLPLRGPPSFGRGTEVTLECDESAFEGGSMALLGLVLARVFDRYASLNSFTETVLRTSQRGEIARWAATPGCRPTI